MVTTQYVMRAFNTALNQHVYWYSLNTPDLSGSKSGYSPLVLTGIAVDYSIAIPNTVGQGNFNIFNLNGDAYGPTNSNTVVALQNNPVKSGLLTSTQDGYVLTWKNTDGYWEAKSGNSGASGSAGGDLTGTYPNPTVRALQTNPVYSDALGSLQDGYVLTWDNPDGYWKAKQNITAAVTDVGQLMSQKRIQYWSGVALAVGGFTPGANCFLVIGTTNFVQQGATTLLNSSSRATALSVGAGPTFLGSYDGSASSASYPCSFVLRGNAAGVGGFNHFSRFGIDQISTSPTLYCFVGLISYAASFPVSNVDFTTQTTTECVGCGFTQTVSGGVFTGNWKIISCNGAAVTVTDSGVAIVAGNLIELNLVAAPNASSITWTLKDLSAATSGTGSITTDLPANTTRLVWQAGMEVHSGGASSNVFSTVRYTMESNY